MKIAGYEITDRNDDTIFVMLPDAGRAALAAVQNHGQIFELVRRADAEAVTDALIAALVTAHNAEMAALVASNSSGMSP